MLSVKEAESIVLNLAQPLDSQRDVETVDLLAASGRILAASVTGSLDFPYWDNSAMDGYAVRFADVENCSAEKPAVLEVVEEIPAGYRPKSMVQSGQAARIFTGGMMPAGADTVVMQEETRREGDRIFILVSPEKPQAFVRHQRRFLSSRNNFANSRYSYQCPRNGGVSNCTVHSSSRLSAAAGGNFFYW
jgi:molybdopterin molybdotransferase